MEQLTLTLTRETRNFIVFENNQDFRLGQIIAKVWIPRKEFTKDVPPEITVGILDDDDMRHLADLHGRDLPPLVTHAKHDRCNEECYEEPEPPNQPRVWVDDGIKEGW